MRKQAIGNHPTPGRGLALLLAAVPWLLPTAILGGIGLAGFIFTPHIAKASTTVTGVIANDTTWTLGGSPYILEGDVVVAPPVTLTIDPGVEVRVMGPYVLLVRGSLTAHGTPDKPILFTGDSTGRWKGLRINSREHQKVSLVSVIVEGADVGVRFELASVNARNEIRDSSLRHNDIGISSAIVTINAPFIRYNVISGNRIGISAGDVFANKVIDNSADGVVGGRTFYSLVARNGGVGIRSGNEVAFSTIQGNGGGGVVDSSNVHDNNLLDNAQYDFKWTRPFQTSAPNNWWGTTDPAAIQKKIFDFHQDPSNAGIVDFTPFATGPVSTVAVSPERSRLVRSAYLSALGREPDPGGLGYWAGTNLTLEQLVTAFQASEEGQRVAAVRALYIELLGRDPLGSDNAGLRGWVDSPYSLEEVRQAILASPEHRRRAG
ncbi:MAG: hypothetical protein HYY02_13265 [Chloroflexi bacterium]|nr:hypothetical protein [Chloroflexota bacterium]